MKIKTIVSNLTPSTRKKSYSLRNWAEADHDDTGANADFAEDIAVGLLDLLELVDFDFNPWLDRATGRRRAIENIRTKYRTKVGRRSLVSLIDLTVAVLGAVKWIDDLPPGCLPVKPRPAESGGRQSIVEIRNYSDIPAASRTLLVESRDLCIAQRDDACPRSDLVAETIVLGAEFESEISDQELEGFPEVKICRVCDQEKPRSGFSPHSTTADRLQTECRSCNTDRVRRRRQEVAQ